VRIPHAVRKIFCDWYILNPCAPFRIELRMSVFAFLEFESNWGIKHDCNLEKSWHEKRDLCTIKTSCKCQSLKNPPYKQSIYLIKLQKQPVLLFICDSLLFPKHNQVVKHHCIQSFTSWHLLNWMRVLRQKQI